MTARRQSADAERREHTYHGQTRTNQHRISTHTVTLICLSRTVSVCVPNREICVVYLWKWRQIVTISFDRTDSIEQVHTSTSHRPFPATRLCSNRGQMPSPFLQLESTSMQRLMCTMRPADDCAAPVSRCWAERTHISWSNTHESAPNQHTHCYPHLSLAYGVGVCT